MSGISAPQEAGVRDHESSLSSITKPCHETNQTPPKTDLQAMPAHSVYTSQPLSEGCVLHVKQMCKLFWACEEEDLARILQQVCLACPSCET